MKIKILAATAFVLLIGNLVLFAVVAVRDSADKNEVINLKSAVLAYQTEYGKLPIDGESTPYDIDLESDVSFMRKLMVTKPPAFYSGREAKHDKANNKWKGGIKSHRLGGGDLFDSHGNLFRIRLDTNSDKSVASPIDKEPIAETVIVWSAGRDGIFETWDDNARSW